MKHGSSVAAAVVIGLTATLPGIAPPAQGADEAFMQQLAAEHAGDRPSANVAATDADVDARTIDYATLDGNPVSGYLARPRDAEGPLPALVVIHEWWGLNDNIRAMARRLAAEGYVALAVDLYEGRTTADPGRARALMQAATERPERLEDNLRQAFFYLDVMPSTRRIGSIGWCFGGGWSLRTALLFPDELDAAVIYYGRLVTDRSRLETLQMPVLGVFGAEDSSIPVERVREFEAALGDLGKPHEIRVYDGAGHAFANPSGDRYVPEAAEAAWSVTLEFLGRHLRGG